METSHYCNPTFLPTTYNSNFHGSIDDNINFRKLPFRRLGNTGLDVSILSYGGSSLGKCYREDIGQHSIDTIRLALKGGINYIDTSPWYGESEALLGEALKGVPRGAYYIGTKVGRNFTPTWEDRFNFSRQAVLNNVENSLKVLGLDYVDIIQVHDLEFCLDQDLIINETLPALESVVRAGKAKYIGLTSYSLEAMKNAVEASSVQIDTILSYCRLNLHDTSLLDYASFFQNKGIGIINAAPIAMGLYTSKGPPDWHPGSDKLKRAVSTITQACEKSGNCIEGVALKFALHSEDKRIATTLVSMPNEDILNWNLKIASTPRTADDKELCQSLQTMLKTSMQGPTHWEGKEVEEYKASMDL